MEWDVDANEADVLRIGSLHERRKQVVRLHKKAIKVMKIVELTGLSYDISPAAEWLLDSFI